MSWLYGPLTSRRIRRGEDVARRLNASDAAGAWGIARAFDARRILVYAMGMEPWLQHLMGLSYDDESRPLLEARALCDLAARHAIPCEILRQTAEIRWAPSHASSGRREDP